MRPIPTEYEPVVEWPLPQLNPWRKMTIAIDGVDHAGKSSTAKRTLAPEHLVLS